MYNVCLIFFADRSYICQSRCRKHKKKNKTFFKIALWYREDSFNHPAERFDKSLKVFCPVTELLKFLERFQEKNINIPSKCFHGHVECSSDNPAWLFLPKSPKFISQGPENIRKKQKFLQDCPMASRKQFRQPGGKRFDKSLKVFCSVTELIKNLERFQEKRYKYSLIILPWTSRMQFGQHCRKIYAKRPKYVPSMSDRKERIFQKTKKKHFKSSPQTPKMLFWQNYLERFNIKPSFFQKTNHLKKNEVSLKKLYLSQNAPLDM